MSEHVVTKYGYRHALRTASRCSPSDTSTLLLNDDNAGKPEGIHMTSSRWRLWRKKS